MTAFWRTWLTVWCWAVGVFGVVLAGAAFEPTSGPARLILGIMNPTAAGEFDALHRFSIGLVGAVTLGWGLTLLAAIQAAVRLGDRQLWLGITGAAIVWYVVDSVISVATGFALNAASNTLIVAAYLLPVLRSGVLSAPAGRLRTA